MGRPLKLPRYVHAFIDRHGRSRFYLRRKGQPKLALPGLPWSPEFMARYQEAMETTKPTIARIGADRIVPRSIRALAIAYYDSAAFKALKPITQGVYRNIIDRFCRETDHAGQPCGDKSAVTLKANHVEKLMEVRSDRPDSANGLRKVLRAMMQVAIKLEWREDEPDPECEENQAEKEGRLPSLDRCRGAAIRGHTSDRQQGAAGVDARALHRASAAGRGPDGRTAYQR